MRNEARPLLFLSLFFRATWDRVRKDSPKSPSRWAFVKEDWALRTARIFFFPSLCESVLRLGEAPNKARESPVCRNRGYLGWSCFGNRISVWIFTSVQVLDPVAFSSLFFLVLF